MSTLDPVSVQATAETWANFCGPHLWGAARFAREAHALESRGVTLPRPHDVADEILANVVAAIFLSVASVEAWGGEVTLDRARATNFPGVASAVLAAEVPRIRGLTNAALKFSRLAELAGAPPLDLTSDPDKAMADLIHLRNKLVHFTPEPFTARGVADSVHDDVEARIRGRFARSPILHASAPLFPQAFASYDCARWAVETARAFVERFAAARGWEHPWTKEIHAAKLVLPRASSVAP